MAITRRNQRTTGHLAPASVKLWQLVYQGVVGAGPAVTIALNFGAGVALAGAGFPLAMAIGTVAVLLVAMTIAQFARHIPSAGSFFSYVSCGLGKEAGFLTGWAAVLYGILFPAVPTMIVASLMPDYFERLLGIRIDWRIWEIGFLIFVWWSSIAGLTRSLRFMIIAGTIECAIVVLIAFGALIDNPSSIASSTIGVGVQGWSGIGLGLIFAFLSFAGFEGVAALAEEAEQPRRSVGRALLLSVLILGALYTFTAWAGLVGFRNDAGAFASSANPYDTIVSAFWAPLWLILAIAILNSGLAGGMAGMLFGSRYILALARAGLAPAVLADVHPHSKSPRNAVHLQFALSILMTLGLGSVLDSPVDVFALLGTTLTLAILLIYIAAEIALPMYFRRYHPYEFSVLHHLIVPAAALVILGFAVNSMSNPLPAAPIGYAFPITLLWMIIGLALVFWLRTYRSQELDSIIEEFAPEESVP